MARMGREVVVGVALLLIQCTSGLDISEEVPSHKQAPVNYDADSQVPQRMTDKDNDEETAYEVLDPVFHEFESEEEFWKKHGEDPFHPWLIFVYAPTCEKSNNYTEVHRKVIAEDEELRSLLRVGMYDVSKEELKRYAGVLEVEEDGTPMWKVFGSGQALATFQPEDQAPRIGMTNGQAEWVYGKEWIATEQKQKHWMHTKDKRTVDAVVRTWAKALAHTWVRTHPYFNENKKHKLNYAAKLKHRTEHTDKVPKTRIETHNIKPKEVWRDEPMEETPKNHIQPISEDGMYAVLNSGELMPLLGLGTWKSKEGEVRTAVEVAIRNGYRHIDCASAYGNEAEVGWAISNMVKAGKVTRDDLFVTSKLWNTHHAAKDVMPALEKSLKDLQLGYLDLYLMHWPMGYRKTESNDRLPVDHTGRIMYSDVHFNETWKAMEELVNVGLVKSIGISNFNAKQIDELYEMATIKPAVLQVESHPYLPQNFLTGHAREKGIAVTAYSPLGSSDRPYALPKQPKLLDDDRLRHVAKKYNKTPAQLAIRFQIQRGNVAIPKSVTPARIKENAEVYDFHITKEDMEFLHKMENGWRACVPQILVEDRLIARDMDHPLYPFRTKY